MLNALGSFGNGSVFDVRDFAKPIERKNQMEAMNALADRSPYGLPTFSEMGVPTDAQYNALADNGGPTQAAAAQVSNYTGAPTRNQAEIGQGIFATALSIGMDPVDLATVISYETAGTFDPTKRGPTTQWGQHRGLIQFGEPQANQYGVNWADPAGSQLGPDGAVARYYRDNGWKPGMGMLDAYSIVNAGGPGLYNRSDATNGGAPGTVRDKVEHQMVGHRQKAQALIDEVRRARRSDAVQTNSQNTTEQMLAEAGL